MYNSIHSEDCDKPSSGKTFSVDTKRFTIGAVNREGSLKYIEIRATTFESYGTGERGGEVKKVERKSFYRLDKFELCVMFRHAVATNILQASDLISSPEGALKRS